MWYREGRWNATAFYSHQAGEKAVKALLYSVNEAPWGHSVRILLERYFKKAGVGRDEGLLRCARELDMHYVLSRYPNAHPAGTRTKRMMKRPPGRPSMLPEG